MAGMVTVDGTVTPGSCLATESETIAPVEGAIPLRVTVPWQRLPPEIEDGLKLTALRVAGVMVRGTLEVRPPLAKAMLAVTVLATPEVLTVNVAEVAPAATVTFVGTVAEGLLLDKVTKTPPDGAAPSSETVPVELFPPTTELGLRVEL